MVMESKPNLALLSQKLGIYGTDMGSSFYPTLLKFQFSLNFVKTKFIFC